MALIDSTDNRVKYRGMVEEGRQAKSANPRRFTPAEHKFLWEKCFQVASQYLGVYTMWRNPYRLMKLNSHSIKLTKELIADVVMFPKIMGEVDLVLKVCDSLLVALTTLKRQKGTFSLEDIVRVAYAYTAGKTDAIR
jgi:hypothetical protein